MNHTRERGEPRSSGNLDGTVLPASPAPIVTKLKQDCPRCSDLDGNRLEEEASTMLGLVRAERKATRFVKDNFDIDDLYDQLDALRAYVHGLSASAGKSASRQFGRARDFASDAAQEAEETMKDNLAASLIIAVGLGIVVRYFIRRGTE